MVTLYSTGCSKCVVLKKKLDEKGIEYLENNDVDAMIEKGLNELPVLEVDGELYPFREAVNWINGSQH